LITNVKIISFIWVSFLIFELVVFTGFSSSLTKENLSKEPDILKAEITNYKTIFQKGLSYSAWSSNAFGTSDSDESLIALKETNSEWIALCFSWFQSNTTSYDIYLDPIHSPSVESLEHAIAAAHDLGLKVMLKPMVEPLEREEIRSYPIWRGEIKPSRIWFDNYSNFLNFFADFAEQNNVEMFCIGCEYKETTGENDQWENVINEIRKRFSGPITYAADWTNYENIEWWDLLDFVGIDAYFPLALFDNDPSLENLINVWSNLADEIENWIVTINKPVIFTEIGYRSGDGTSMAPANYWADMNIDLQEQSDCYEAAFQALWYRDWFNGFYWWTWIHDPNKGGLFDSGHTPQNKPAQDVIKKWYSLERKNVVVDQTYTTTEKCYIGELQSVGFHLSWNDDGSDVVNGSLFVNGTEYITNGTGWAIFDVYYNTIGKRSWTITNIQHINSTSYFIDIEPPAIIWDEIEVDIDSSRLGFGFAKVRVHIIYSFTKVSIANATIFVNGKQCKEIESGLYEIDLNSWSPYHEIKLQANIENFPEKIFSETIINFINLLVYGVIAVLILTLSLFFIRRRKKT
jgi:hypothetical protein